MVEFTVTIFILTHSSSEMTPNWNPYLTGTRNRTWLKPRSAGVPSASLDYFYVYLLSTHKIYHLPNNQQQSCMDSLLVTGRGRRCYDDRSMWDPEWSELIKGKGHLPTVNTTSVSTLHLFLRSSNAILRMLDIRTIWKAAWAIH